MAAFFPGLGAGFGKSLNLDVDAGAGGFAGAGIPVPPPAYPPPGALPPPGFGGGMPPWYGGFGGVPYVPVTPLGALGGVKGDLLVPIVAVGVAIFLLIIIILAVKAALTWKLSLLSGAAAATKSHEKWRRDTNATPGPPEEDQLNHLATMVLSAIQSQSCAQNMICQIGTYARAQQGLPSLLRILETVMPASVQEPLKILRDSAEGSVNCEKMYKCSSEKPSGGTTTTPKPNSI